MPLFVGVQERSAADIPRNSSIQTFNLFSRQHGHWGAERESNGHQMLQVEVPFKSFVHVPFSSRFDLYYYTLPYSWVATVMQLKNNSKTTQEIML